MKKLYSIAVLLLITIPVGLLFQNCAGPSNDGAAPASTTAAATDTATGTPLGGATSTGDASATTSTAAGFGTTGATTTTTVSTNFDVQLLDSTVAGQLKVQLAIGNADVGKYGSIMVAALYANVWYFWDVTKTPETRWVAIADVNTATSYPEYGIGNATASITTTITEVLPEAHGAVVYVGVGYGADAAARRTDMLNASRYKLIYTVP